MEIYKNGDSIFFDRKNNFTISRYRDIRILWKFSYNFFFFYKDLLKNERSEVGTREM